MSRMKEYVDLGKTHEGRNILGIIEFFGNDALAMYDRICEELDAEGIEYTPATVYRKMFERMKT